MKKKPLFPRTTSPPWETQPLVLVLDNIRSGYNVGAAFRLADAFLLAHIYLCGITPTPPHTAIRKTALGAENNIPWTHVASTDELLDALKKQGYQLIGVELAEPSIYLHQLTQVIKRVPCALIFGHELYGISDAALQKVDVCVEIPQYGSKFSMNVATCMGMVVWEALRTKQP